MFGITQKSIVAVAVVAVVGSVVVSANAAVAAKPLQRPAASYLGEASLEDTGVLTLDVKQVLAGRGAQAQLVGREARLLTGPATRITNVQGGLVARTLLDHALVRVQGRLLPVSAWPLNDEGERLPSIRVSRIVVVQLQVEDATDSEGAPAQDNSETASQD